MLFIRQSSLMSSPSDFLPCHLYSVDVIQCFSFAKDSFLLFIFFVVCLSPRTKALLVREFGRSIGWSVRLHHIKYPALSRSIDGVIRTFIHSLMHLSINRHLQTPGCSNTWRFIAESLSSLSPSNISHPFIK